METKIVFWKQYDVDEDTFSLLEVFEDGRVLDRSFKAQKKGRRLFDETNRKSYTLNAEILIEKIEFDKDGKLEVNKFDKNTEIYQTFTLNQWQKARKVIEKLQDDTIENMCVDYHSIIHLKKDTLPEHLRKLLNKKHFTIVNFRYEKEGSTLIKKRYPERLETRFVPQINERIYFDLLTENNHLTTTGDNIFALHTQDCEKDFCVTDFEDYIANMLKKIKDNPKHYQALFMKQRTRRVEIDTEQTGDLFPR